MSTKENCKWTNTSDFMLHQRLCGESATNLEDFEYFVLTWKRELRKVIKTTNKHISKKQEMLQQNCKEMFYFCCCFCFWQMSPLDMIFLNLKVKLFPSSCTKGAWSDFSEIQNVTHGISECHPRHLGFKNVS